MDLDWVQNQSKNLRQKFFVYNRRKLKIFAVAVQDSTSNQRPLYKPYYHKISYKLFLPISGHNYHYQRSISAIILGVQLLTP